MTTSDFEFWSIKVTSFRYRPRRCVQQLLQWHFIPDIMLLVIQHSRLCKLWVVYIYGWSATITDLVYTSYFLPQLIMHHNTHMPQPLCLHCWGFVFSLLSLCGRAGVSHYLCLISGHASRNKNPAFKRTCPSIPGSALLSKYTATPEKTLWSTFNAGMHHLLNLALQHASQHWNTL